MAKRGIIWWTIVAASAVIMLLSETGCDKEYSYEGGRRDTVSNDTVIIRDSTLASVQFPVCASCNGVEQPAPLTWNFKSDTFTLCGVVDTAISNPDRTGFTFFGPSACSLDSGMVVTIYLPIDLKADRSHVLTNRVAFYYYDNVTPSYIFISSPEYPFSLTIDQYDHQTGVTTGVFSGWVLTRDGKKTQITAGTFSIVLK